MSKFIKLNILSIILSIIMFASWIFNMGWLRFFGTFMLIALWHAGMLFFLNNIAACTINENKNVVYPLIAINITFLLPHLLFPDGGDTGEMYIFFHLIENGHIADISIYFGLATLLLHAVAIISLIIVVILYLVKRSQSN